MKVRAGRLSRRGLLGRISPRRTRLFEDIVITRLSRIGPVIAASDPNSALPRLGAAKMTFPHEAWENDICELARTAVAVVVSATTAKINKGLLAEIRMLAGEVGHRRLILLLGTGSKDSVGTRWESFARAFDAHCIGGPVLQLGLGGAAQVVAYLPNRGWFSWASRSRSEWSYAVAVELLLQDVAEHWRKEHAITSQAISAATNLHVDRQGKGEGPIA